MTDKQTGRIKFNNFQDDRVWVEPINIKEDGYGRWVYNSELLELLKQKSK